jgi:ubiquinone/menaquinone biosynthesis C-methylase UbiE
MNYGCDLQTEWVRRRQTALYQRIAPIYAAWVRLGSFGAFPRLYRQACAALELAPGDVVLDMCCGTGELFPYLAEAVTKSGHIIGCDQSPAMLAHAERRIARHGWHNITLVQSDALAFISPRPLNAAIFSICLSAIPWREAVLDHVIKVLPSGARIVVVDSLCIHDRMWCCIPNFYNRVKGRVIGADPDCDLAEQLMQRLDEIETVVSMAGIYSLFRGRNRNGFCKPAR